MPEAIRFLDRADTFFMSSRNGTVDMDTNIRGGPPGFVRVVSNEPSGVVFVYPEYSGNRLYQSLGNLQVTPLGGFVFPDFETGNALFATGKVEILVGKNAAAVLPRSNLAVRVTVTAARYVEKSLAFRGIAGSLSPYNPSVRYLATEKATPAMMDGPAITATLVRKEIITPRIGRFRFRISDPKQIGSWTPGQYATFSFQEELDMGYRHMQDDDPSSLNDDYVRTFTISSHPDKDLPPDEFEITARKNGNVTSHLFRTNERAGLEVPLKGFGGDFVINSHGGQDLIPFIAGGIGITPVLAQLPGLDISRLHLSWSMHVDDIGLVVDTFHRFPELPQSTRLFLTGPDPQDDKVVQHLKAIMATAARVERRRIDAADLDLSLADVWYFCGSPVL
ncbi:putative oxidoreductase, partial [Aspergillus steynii IBT 23096]